MSEKEKKISKVLGHKDKLKVTCAVVLVMIFVLIVIIGVWENKGFMIITQSELSGYMLDRQTGEEKSQVYKYDPSINPPVFRNAFEEEIIEKYKNGETDWEDVYFAVSGVDSYGEIKEYKDKLDKIYSDFEIYYQSYKVEYYGYGEVYIKGEAIHNFLFEDKEDYYSKEYDTFAEVIDNFINYEENEEKKIGQCLSLCALYNAIAERAVLEVRVGISESHAISILSESEDIKIYVENTYAEGYSQLPQYYDFYFDEPNIAFANVYNKKGEGLINKSLYISESPSALIALYRFYADRNQEDVCESIFNRVVRDYPHKPWMYIARGHAYRKKQKYLEALVDYSTAIGLSNGSYGDFYCWRGIAYKGLGKRDYAIRDWIKAEDLGVTDDYERWWLYYSLAELYLEQGDMWNAEWHAKKSIELDSENAWGYYVLGQIYCEQKRLDKAEETFVKALNYCGGDEQLKNDIEDMRQVCAAGSITPDL